jgi:hypothetical protein
MNKKFPHENISHLALFSSLKSFRQKNFEEMFLQQERKIFWWKKKFLKHVILILKFFTQHFSPFLMNNNKYYALISTCEQNS